jgi:hypothetical protein
MIGRVENIWTELGEPGKWGGEQEERGDVFISSGFGLGGSEEWRMGVMRGNIVDPYAGGISPKSAWRLLW